jgi:hypothetical protein
MAATKSTALAKDTRAAAKQREYLNWSKMEPKEAAKKGWEMCRTHEYRLGWRHSMAMRGAMAYNGATGGNLFENLMFEHPMTEDARTRANKGSGRFKTRSDEQHARAMCQTAVQVLFGMRQPKSQLVATDAPYEVRRQGVWADRFIEGNMHQEQGSYLDLWQMARQGALLGMCSTGMVAIRTEPDFVAKNVRNQLRSTLNTFIDPADRAGDRPLSYFDVTWENPEYLIEDPRWKGKSDAIWRAAAIPRHLQQGSYDGASFNTPMVKLLTCWRMPFGTFKGRHAIFIGGDSASGIGGGDGEWLWWEDWEPKKPPLSFWRVNRALGDDFWGENMIEPALRPLADAEEIDAKAKVTMRRTSQTIISLDGSTSMANSMANAKDVVLFRYSSKLQEKAPEVIKAGLLNGDYFDYQTRKIALAHELVGIPMLHQAAEVQGSAGNRSGASIRREASLLPERFADMLRGWENWLAVDCAENQIRAAREIGKVEPNWQVTWPGQDFEANVSVEVLDIDRNQYRLQAYAVSEQKNTPADRASAAQEMYDRGEINDAQLELIIEGLYDTKSETKQSTAERAYVSKTIDEILHAKEEVIEDENAYLRDTYVPPMPWMDPKAMAAQAAPRYTQAMIDKVPQNRRFLLRRFMEDIWALKQQLDKEEAVRNAAMSITAETSDPFAAPAGGALGQPPATPALPGAAPLPALPSGAPPGMPLGAPPGAPAPAPALV